MKIAALIARILPGLVFLVFGANGLLGPWGILALRHRQHLSGIFLQRTS
jgi:hypothetical protein